MTSVDALFGAGIAVAGGVVAVVVARTRLRRPPPALMRSNFRGRTVPAVLGDAIACAGAFGIAASLAVKALGATDRPPLRWTVAALIVVGVMYAAGAWDDRKGDERPRGFRGHLTAAREGSVTGGIVKLGAGAGAGAAAAALLVHGIANVVTTAAIVALTANAVNLFDRAPGRASKVALVLAVVATVTAPPSFVLVAAGIVGGAAGSLPFDLSERGMLGDSGANPLGATIGLGLAVAFGPLGRAVTLVVLAALNVASERWSFSRVISATPMLDYLDRIGRK